MFQVGLKIADDLIISPRVIVLAAERDGGAECYGLPRKLERSMTCAREILSSRSDSHPPFDKD